MLRALEMIATSEQRRTYGGFDEVGVAFYIVGGRGCGSCAMPRAIMFGVSRGTMSFHR
jgi:hypothetical protein